ncbi:hypothetical protein I7I51_04736 [Histoplasma capsulatum]|uniref:Uncharacterized protein n=1 Tax=Ajellomyces capsulatus TaxID=5037 RepID=A0A8A1M3L8_AJECA|nr:hypothetical protein I7I51_04736 [Histoplasma capsulatum]
MLEPIQEASLGGCRIALVGLKAYCTQQQLNYPNNVTANLIPLKRRDHQFYLCKLLPLEGADYSLAPKYPIHLTLCHICIVPRRARTSGLQELGMDLTSINEDPSIHHVKRVPGDTANHSSTNRITSTPWEFWMVPLPPRELGRAVFIWDIPREDFEQLLLLTGEALFWCYHKRARCQGPSAKIVFFGHPRSHSLTATPKIRSVTNAGNPFCDLLVFPSLVSQHAHCCCAGSRPASTAHESYTTVVMIEFSASGSWPRTKNRAFLCSVALGYPRSPTLAPCTPARVHVAQNSHLSPGALFGFQASPIFRWGHKFAPKGPGITRYLERRGHWLVLKQPAETVREDAAKEV